MVSATIDTTKGESSGATLRRERDLEGGLEVQTYSDKRGGGVGPPRVTVRDGVFVLRTKVIVVVC